MEPPPVVDEGKIVVFSSHVLEVVEQVCSRVVILKDGHMVGHDSVANLRSTCTLPSLDAVLVAVISDEHVDERSKGLGTAIKTKPAGE
jgi:ABC-2 type transport system ATP-binding protein